MLAVRLRGATVTYEGTYGGAAPALAGVDLDICAGEHVALVGPSGAGKSTLLALCNGMLRPSAGRVEVLGVDLGAASRAQRRAVRPRVGTIHQQLHLVGPLRVVHNVNAGRLGRWGTLRSLASLVRPLGTAEVADALRRVGIEEMLDRRTDRLSGGEQQRVALARILVQDPDLILADEPVSSLDPARSEEVMALLTRVVADRRRTLLVSLHDFEIARRRCQRMVGLRDGRIVFDLPADQVGDAARDELYLARA